MASCAGSSYWAALADGVCVRVRVTARARAAGIGGVVATAEGPALDLRVAAPPEGGKANAAVAAALADAMDLPRRAVSLESGATHRVKRLKLAGDPMALADRLRVLA